MSIWRGIVEQAQQNELDEEKKRLDAELATDRALRRASYPGTLSMTEYLASFDDSEKKEAEVLSTLAKDRAAREAAEKEKQDAADGPFPPPSFILPPAK